MFNLGLPEILVIGAAALLVFGPKRLPELAKSLGQGIRDFKKALDGEDEKKESLPPAPHTTVQHTVPHGIVEPEKTPVAPGDPSNPSHKS